jgi:hypothetical protein
LDDDNVGGAAQLQMEVGDRDVRLIAHSALRLHQAHAGDRDEAAGTNRRER